MTSAEPGSDVQPLTVAEFVEQLVTAASWAETVHLMNTHQELVAPAALQLEQMRATAGDDVAGQIFAFHHRLLVLTLQVGVTRALAEFAPFKTDEGRPADIRWIESLVADLATQGSWHRRRQFLEERPFLLNGLAADLAELLAEDQADLRAAALIRQTGAFLRRCQAIGLIEAVLEAAVLNMIYAPSSVEALRVAGDYPPVLSSHADTVARQHIENLTDPVRREFAVARWAEIRQAVADATSRDTSLLLDQLDFSDLLDQLAATTDTDGLLQLLTEHPELLADTARQALERRRDESESFLWWWNWDRYLRLLRQTETSTPAEAVAAFQAADRYEFSVGSVAVLHATSAEQVYLLFLAYPGLRSGHVIETLAKLEPQLGDSSLATKIQLLRKFAADDPQAVNQYLSAEAWNGRTLAREASAAFRQWSMSLHQEIASPDQESPPGGPDLCLGLLEVVIRLGTLEAPEIMELTSAAASLHLRQSQSGAAADRAVDLLEQSAASAGPDRQAAVLANLANGYGERFSRLGKVDDLDAAVSATRRALNAVAGDADRHQVLMLLVRLLSGYPAHAYDPARTQEALHILDRLRGDETGAAPGEDAGQQERLHDLEMERLLVLCSAVFATPSADEVDALLGDATSLARELNNSSSWLHVAEAATSAYTWTDRPKDGETGWTAVLAAEDAAPDADSRQRARSARATLLAKYAERQTDVARETGVGVMLTDALQLTDPGASSAGQWSADVDAERRGARALVLITRYHLHEGREEDLRQAVDLLRGLQNERDARRMMVPVLLGDALSALYEVTGELTTLDEAIGLYQQMVARYPGHLGLRSCLGSSWRRRFLQSGKVSDLNRAITVLEEAGTDGAMSMMRVSLMNNLANAYGTRFEMLADAADADRSVDLLEELVATVPPESLMLPRALSNLAVILTERAMVRGGAPAGDFWRVLEVAARADELTLDTSPFKARRLVNRAIVHQFAAHKLNSAEHADAAITFLERALELAGPDSPFRAQYQSDLASALSIKAHATGDQRYLQEAVRMGDEALEALRIYGPSWLPQVSDLVGGCHVELGQWDRAAWTLSLGAEVLDLLAGTQPQRLHRHGWRRRAGSLPMNAAYALAKTGDLAAAAATAERGRATELTRALNLFPAEMAELSRSGFGRLAQRWQNLAARVARQELNALEDTGPDHSAAIADNTLEQLREVLAQVEQISGGGPDSRSRPGPSVPGTALVYLITTSWGGLAVVVCDDRPSSAVWLPDLTAMWVEEAARKLIAATPDELEMLLPGLLDELRPQLRDVVNAASGLPIVLVATGLLGLLPLQAATARPPGDGTISTDASPGLVAFRHAPNARVLSRRGATPLLERPMAASVTAVRSALDHLAYVAAETQMAATALGAGAVLPTDGGVSPDAVLEALGEPGVVHFACHARAVPVNPLESALMLGENVELTLRDILRSTLTADLVIMSACETAVPGDELPDEVIGLPAGLLQAGAGGVVGTLWPVADDACLWLMLCFYERLRAGSPPWEALCAAQEWLSCATGEQLKLHLAELADQDPSWPPHEVIAACNEIIGLIDPTTRPYANPADWAGFIYMG